MTHGGFTLRTSADADAVAAFLADFRHHPAWRDDVLSCEVESGEPGADGTVYRQHVRQGPGTSDRRVEAYVAADRSRIAFQTLDDGPVLASGTTEIVPGDDGCTVDSSIEISFHGRGNLLRPVVARVLESRIPAYRDALSRELDRLVTTAPR